MARGAGAPVETVGAARPRRIDAPLADEPGAEPILVGTTEGERKFVERFARRGAEA